MSNVIGQNLRSIQRSITINNNGASKSPIDRGIQSLTGEHKGCLGVAQRTRKVAAEPCYSSAMLVCRNSSEFRDADAAVTELKAEASCRSNQNLEAAL
jgi:hypothetical protein